MFRWPVELTALSLASAGAPREAMLDVSPRGATFMLAALSHVGHAAHLAVVDAYLKGQVRLTDTTGIGDDSRVLTASLAAPLVAAAELGLERLTLSDLILLPRDLDAARTADIAASGGASRSPDSARFLLRAGDTWHWVRAAERFEQPGCLGTRRVGMGEAWHDLVAQLPDPLEIESYALAGRWRARLTAELREPSLAIPAPDVNLRSALRSVALARFSGSAALIQRAAGRLSALLGDDARERIPISPADARLGPLPPMAYRRATQGACPGQLKQALAFVTGGLELELTQVPGLDGYGSLCLLPPADAAPGRVISRMREAAWSAVEALIGRPLAERRTEPFALRLVGADRTTTLDVGESLVIVRNQTVFAAWVGSDGRVMIRVFPPGGSDA